MRCWGTLYSQAGFCSRPLQQSRLVLCSQAIGGGFVEGVRLFCMLMLHSGGLAAENFQ